ncbi:STAS domain-containing protein [Thiolapillus sp.]|uniref:STAS domain-containing protein n=1 Tax=Thiolapillus sp. TaxID=2017437 RepID=UPI003AF63153
MAGNRCRDHAHKRVPYIDQSGLYAIEDALLTLQDKNVLVLMTGLQEQPRDMLEKVGVIPNLVPEENLYPDFQSAIKALETGRAGYRQDKLAGTG